MNHHESWTSFCSLSYLQLTLNEIIFSLLSMKPTEVLEKIGSFELHVPVLLREILEIFSVFKEEPKYLDGTFGRGGHYRCLKMMLPKLMIFLIQITNVMLLWEQN